MKELEDYEKKIHEIEKSNDAKIISLE